MQDAILTATMENFLKPLLLRKTRLFLEDRLLANKNVVEKKIPETPCLLF